MKYGFLHHRVYRRSARGRAAISLQTFIEDNENTTLSLEIRFQKLQKSYTITCEIYNFLLVYLHQNISEIGKIRSLFSHSLQSCLSNLPFRVPADARAKHCHVYLPKILPAKNSLDIVWESRHLVTFL